MADKGITAKVCRSGGRAIEVALSTGNSVEDAIDAAGLNLKTSEVVQVNGEEVDRSELSEMKVEDGDRIILVKNIQGGM